MKKSTNSDLNSQAIAFYGLLQTYKLSNLDELMEKLKELERMGILIAALQEIANGHLQENVSERIASNALDKFKEEYE